MSILGVMSIGWGFVWRLAWLGALFGALLCAIFVALALHLILLFSGMYAAICLLAGVVPEIWRISHAGTRQ